MNSWDSMGPVQPETHVALEAGRSIFVGFKLGTGLRRQLEALEGPDRKYVSAADSTFLRICKVGEDFYVGKLLHERLTTDRVDDVKRNVASILQRLCPDTRLPQIMDILPGPRDGI